MPKEKNAVWRFFASVKLALITLFTLAVTSIIGTLIQQGKAPSYYVQEYGPNWARLFDLLDLTNMYSSWWYLALLFLFAVNLVICSIERLPGVWRLVVMDNLTIDLRKLEKMRFTQQTETNLTTAAAAESVSRVMHRVGWRNPRRRDRENGVILLCSQRGAWTRFGVYIVHVSILFILAGSVIGTLFGYKAYVFLSEGRPVENVYLQESREAIPLDFQLYCDKFEKTFYPNGMVKEFRTDLTVYDPNRQETYRKSIVVNDPLSHGGLTFYQGDAYPLEEFYMVLRNGTTGTEQAFRVPPQREVAWPGTDASFRIDEIKHNQDDTVQEAKILFKAAAAVEPSAFWLRNNGSISFEQAGEEFTLSFRQLYSVLLLVTRDPGVWIVYFGCALMILGLGTVFFLAHHRLWVYIAPRERQGSLILISGVSNKHQTGFGQRFHELVDHFRQDGITS